MEKQSKAMPEKAVEKLGGQKEKKEKQSGKPTKAKAEKQAATKVAAGNLPAIIAIAQPPLIFAATHTAWKGEMELCAPSSTPSATPST